MSWLSVPQHKGRSLVALAFSLVVAPLLLACPAEAGQQCDGFFANGCVAPSTCVDMDDKSVCAVSCETDFDGEASGKIGGKYCPEGLEIVEVVADVGGQTASMGCHCVPK